MPGLSTNRKCDIRDTPSLVTLNFGVTLFRDIANNFRELCGIEVELTFHFLVRREHRTTHVVVLKCKKYVARRRISKADERSNLHSERIALRAIDLGDDHHAACVENCHMARLQCPMYELQHEWCRRCGQRFDWLMPMRHLEQLERQRIAVAIELLDVSTPRKRDPHSEDPARLPA